MAVATKAVVQRCSVEKVSLEISQNSQDFQVKTISKDVASANLLKKRLWHLYFPVNFLNFKNSFLYGTPLVTASE